MKITIYDQVSGQIMRVVDCHQQDLQLQYDASTQGYLDGDYSDDAFYVIDGAPLGLPAQPTHHHTFNWQSKQWLDPRTLQDLKDAVWTVLKQARSQAEYAGFIWDGSLFDSDQLSQNRITGAVTLAQLSTDFSIGWVLANNSVRTLNQAGMLQVGAALGTHVATQFAKGVLLRAQLQETTSIEQLQLIHW